jgi:hypothetical protein
MLATEPKPATLTEKDFLPPFKRQEAAVPGYWTIDELAAELQVTVRKVQYDIKAKQGTRIYKAGRTLLLSDTDALAYLWQQRHKKS